MTRTQDSNSPEGHIKRVTSKKYIAPVVAVAIAVLGVLTYVVSITDAWDKVKERFGPNHHQKDLELAAYNLGKDLAEVEMHKTRETNDKAKRYPDASTVINQYFVQIGAELDKLGVKIDYKNLDYEISSPMHSQAHEFVGSEVDGLKNQRLLQYYELGHQLTGIEVGFELFRYRHPYEITDDISKLNKDLTALNYPPIGHIELTEPEPNAQYVWPTGNDFDAIIDPLDDTNKQIIFVLTGKCIQVKPSDCVS